MEKSETLHLSLEELSKRVARTMGVTKQSVRMWVNRRKQTLTDQRLFVMIPRDDYCHANRYYVSSKVADMYIREKEQRVAKMLDSIEVIDLE
jgi:cell division septal protein FtsQ